MKLISYLGLSAVCICCVPNSDSASMLRPQNAQKPHVDNLVLPEQQKWLQGLFTPNAASVKTLVVFGDSLSDRGNLHKRTLGFYIPPNVFYKSRFCNGPNWVDYVEASTGWSVLDYAVGGARTKTIGLVERIAIPSFLQQISENTLALKSIPPATTLIHVWIGPNNYFNEAQATQDAHLKPIAPKLQALAKETVEDIRTGIVKLNSMGFQKFVVGSMVQLGGLPRNPKSKSQTSDETYFAATEMHNRFLQTVLNEISQSLDGIKIAQFNAFEVDTKSSAPSNTFGFSRFDKPCYEGDSRGRLSGKPVFCQDHMAYKYWDWVHPNSMMQCFYAAQWLADSQILTGIRDFDLSKAQEKCVRMKAHNTPPSPRGKHGIHF